MILTSTGLYQRTCQAERVQIYFIDSPTNFSCLYLRLLACGLVDPDLKDPGLIFQVLRNEHHALK